MFSFNKRNVVELLFKEYEDLEKTRKSDDEIRIKDVIKDLLERYEKYPCTDIEEEISLEFYKMSDSREDHQQSENSDCGSTDSESVHDTADKDDKATQSYKENAVAYWNSLPERKRAKKKRPFTAVQHMYKKLKSVQQLYRWEQSAAKGGTNNEKYKTVDKWVLDKFKEAIGNCVNVHDVDLRRWGLEAAKEMNLPTFKASKSWCHRFKRKNDIVSRKVTKVVTRAHIFSQDDISEKAKDFVAEVKAEMETVSAKNTYNSDQSGFNIELHSGRSLESKGIRTVKKVVQSVNATTHSYTTQPTVHGEGEFWGPMLLVLSEPSGSFGPVVAKNMFKAPNLKVVATKSGKCTKAVLQEWYKTLIRPNVHEKSLLLLDSYGGFKSAASNEDNDVPEDENTEGFAPIIIKRIPKHTTWQIQPLDVLGFRPYKELDRRIADLIMLHKEDFSLRERDNIIKLQSPLYSTVSSPRFREMFKMGWFKGGYLDNHPSKYETPVKYCFPMLLPTCGEENCEAPYFIRCSWCTEFFCFTYFFKDYHLCDNFVE